MPENEMEKWGKIQARSGIAALIVSGCGLPPAYYCAYAQYKSGTSAGSTMMSPTHFDVAFVLLIAFYCIAAVAGIFWLVYSLKIRKATSESIAKLTIESAPSALLSPLQADIIQLSRDLRQMMKDLGPAPEFINRGPMEKGQDPRDWTIKALNEAHEWMVPYAVWSRKLIYSYRESFAERVAKLQSAIGRTTGLVVAPLEPYTRDVFPGDDFRRLIDVLMDFFVQIENPKIKPAPNFGAMIPVQQAVPLFSELQIEAFQLERDLKSFMERMGPRPELDWKPDGLDRWPEHYTETQTLQAPWGLRFRSEFSEKFAPRVKSLKIQLGKQSIDANELTHFTESIANEEQIPILQTRLICLAHLVDGVKIRQEKPNEA